MSKQNQPTGQEVKPFERLNHEDRLLLMRFICSFAWADLEIRDEERALVSSMIRRLQFNEREGRQIREWLEVPPRPDAVDPANVPKKHREVFLEAMRSTIAADGQIAPEEQESLSLFGRLIR